MLRLRIVSFSATLLLLASSTSSGAAQVTSGKLTGFVTDAQTGQPLAGVQIFIDELSRGTLTQADGRYFLLSVPPGTYTVSAQLIGYATVRKENVRITVDVTRTLSFQLPSEAVAVEEIVVQAERVPLIETGATGSRITTTAQELEALPVVSIDGALSLEQGFLSVPGNTTIRSYLSRRRQPLSPVRIRGGRGSETLMLVDGIPVNNFVFGGPAIDLSTLAIQQIDFIKGGFAPEYGNALSGIINITTREGGTELEGALEYQTSALPGALGSRPDELRGYDMIQGRISGPVPGTDSKLRFMIVGRQQNGREAVYQFDDQIFDPGQSFDTQLNSPNFLDVLPGWRAFGFEQERDVIGKLTYYFTPAAKLNFTLIDYTLEHQGYDFDFILTGFDPLDSPAAQTAADSVFYNDVAEADVVFGSNHVSRRLGVLSYNQTIGRTAFTLAAGIFDQSRTRCNFFEGVCLRNSFADLNFIGRFAASGITANHPTEGTDNFYGGEVLRTAVIRADIQSQISDHHNIQSGIYYEAHDLTFEEFQAIESDQPFEIVQRFAAEADDLWGVPYASDLWNAAAYIQDNIEYDFITIRLGFRYDLGQAGGSFFADPLDPTNGTTALNVCANPGAFGADPAYFTGQTACSNQAIRDSAAIIAHEDDFEEASVRQQFSPRLGVSFPVTASSSIFFNYGRNTQNPLLINLFRNTFIGTLGEGVPCGSTFLARNPLPDNTLGQDADNDPDARPINSAELGLCGPVLFSPRLGQQFLGNPNLLTESTNSYEFGFLSEIGRNYAIRITLFNKDQFGLTGVREARFSDIGETYGTSGAEYSILVNQDYQTVRGLEIGLQRRMADHWGFNINYSYSRARTNAAPPQREFEAQVQEGDQTLRREITSEIDRPHVFNATLRVAVAEDEPDIPFGNLLRNSQLAVTFQAASGFPYTPILRFNPDPAARAERYSGRMPGHWVMGLRASKAINWDGVEYGLFLRVNNLFDSKYCVQVFQSTGRCDQGTIDQGRARLGNPIDESVSSTYFDRPHFFGARRSISVGMSIEF